MGFCDYKAQTLELVGKNVSLFLKENSDLYYKNHGKIDGTLIGRVWGEQISEESACETIIAVRLRTEDGIEEIPCTDISFIIPKSSEHIGKQ